MATDVLPENLDFPEAIEYFRGKVNLPTEKWTDLMKGQHARAFVVAGATKAELLTDIRAELDKALAQGTGLEEFRAAFDEIVARHGWSYKGSRNWRTKVIFETNMRTAYQAGRYAQLKEAIALRPFWQYRHGDSLKPRPLHQSWDRKVLRHDDPWWDSHYPPNGWGCKCTVVGLGEEDLADQGKKGPDKAPDNGVGPKPDPVTGEPVPAGIDPGWDYNVGEAAWGRRLSDQAMSAWQSQSRAEAFEKLTPGDWETLGRPERLPQLQSRVKPAPPAKTVEAFEDRMRDVLGGEEKVFPVGKGDWEMPVLVNAESVAAHVELERSAFADFLPELLEAPQEAWLGFERHKGTGRVSLRLTVVRAVATAGQRMLMVAQASRGYLEGWTFIPTSDLKYLNRQRWGLLIHADDEAD